jgi:GNAT superfamily N-acetyltransferase
LTFGTSERAACLALELLAVDPAHQGLGIGRTLVAGGLERARSLNRGVSVISADGKERFYKQCGFEELVGKITDGGERNPLNGVRGGEVRFWWPNVGAARIDASDA